MTDPLAAAVPGIKPNDPGIDVRLIDIAIIEKRSNRDIEEDSPAMLDLIESIRLNGVLLPLLVFITGNRHQLVSGYRRLHAAIKAGLTHVPCRIIAPPSSSLELKIIQATENLHRKDVDPIWFGSVLLQIKEKEGCTSKELAKKFSLTNSGISRYFRAAELRPELKTHVSGGQLPLTCALELDALPEELRSDLLPKALAGTVTRDSLSAIRKQTTRRAAEKSGGGKSSRITAVLEMGRTVTISGDVLTLESFISTLEELLNRARRVRPTGVELRTFLNMLRDQAEMRGA